MMLSLSREIIETIIIIEFILIFLIVFTTYITKIISYFKERRQQKLTGAIESYLTYLVLSNQPFAKKEFHRSWTKIQILFPIFIKLDKEYGTNQVWQHLKMDFLKNILLPLARKGANSRRWMIRLFSCEVFGLIYEKQDELRILGLLKDTVPLVYLHAITAAIKSNSSAAINEVIIHMAKMNWLTQPMYLEPFEQASPEAQTIVAKRIQITSNASIKAECYKILRKFPPAIIPTLNIKEDLNAKDFELRLAALKFLVYTDVESAIPVLLEKLKDEHWEVRLVAIHRLGRLKLQETILQIADCLHDTVWWVKMSAAEALKCLGDEGEKILKLQAPELSLISFDATEHVSKTLW